MNLKLSAFIFFTSTLLISLPTSSLAQEAKDSNPQLDIMRAALYDLAHLAAPTTLDIVVPANFSDLNPPARKREEPEPPRVIFYVCEEPLLGGRCEKLSSKRGFCYELKNGWDDEISSLCPQVDTKCTVYDDGNCKAPILKDIVWPGIVDLAIPLPPNGLSYINNKIGSYSCV